MAGLLRMEQIKVTSLRQVTVDDGEAGEYFSIPRLAAAVTVSLTTLTLPADALLSGADGYTIEYDAMTDS